MLRGRSLVSADDKSRYPVKQGIIVIEQDPKAWMDVTPYQMQRILAAIGERNWPEVLTESKFLSNEQLFLTIVDEYRANLQFLLVLPPHADILEVGPGWGNMTVPLALRGFRVTAVGTSFPHLFFIRKRAQQEGVNELSLICASILRSPFAPHQFDLVVMIGVLEWVAENEPGAVRELQLQAPRNRRGALRLGGQFVLGTEISHRLKYLYGAKDDHTGLPGVTFRSRPLADAIARQAGRDGYRTYTYGKSGYERLLQEAGFRALKWWLPRPDYKNFL